MIRLSSGALEEVEVEVEDEEVDVDVDDEEVSVEEVEDDAVSVLGFVAKTSG